MVKPKKVNKDYLDTIREWGIFNMSEASEYAHLERIKRAMTNEARDDLRAIVTLAKELGVAEMKIEGLHFRLHPPAPTAVDFDARMFADRTATPASEDEAKFWSVGGPGIKDGNGDELVPPMVGEDIE